MAISQNFNFDLSRTSEGYGGFTGRGFNQPIQGPGDVPGGGWTSWGDLYGQKRMSPGSVSTQPVPGGTMRGPETGGIAMGTPSDPQQVIADMAHRFGLAQWGKQPQTVPGVMAPAAPMGTPSPAAPPAPVPSAATGGFQFTPQQGQSVNLPGFDSSRTDLDPKQVFGQFAQAWQNSGRPWGGDAVRAFVANDPRWEIDPASSAQDPRIRVKQDILNSWKPGTSVYQDVVGDAGGQNRIQYINDPASAAALGFGGGGQMNTQPVPTGSMGTPYHDVQPGSMGWGGLYGSSFGQQTPLDVMTPGGMPYGAIPGVNYFGPQ